MNKALPDSWASVQLANIAADISYGYTASAKDTGPGPRLLRITDIQDGQVDWDKVPFCECDSPTRHRLVANDIVIARTGATTGKSFLLKGELPEAVFASYLIRVRPGEAVWPDFLANFMKCPDYWTQITQVSKGTAQPGANASLLGKLTIPVAPFAEQRRISDKLEVLQLRSQRAREALDEVPALIEKLRQSILAAAFRGDLTKDWRAKNPNVEPAEKLLQRIREERRATWEKGELAKLAAKGRVPTDEKWRARYRPPTSSVGGELPEIPSHWTWASVEELSCLVTDGDHNPPKRVPSGIPHLTAKNVKGQKLLFDDCSFVSPEGFEQTRQRYEPLPGDVIITCVGTLGETAIVPPGLVFSADRNLAAIRLINPGILTEFLLWWLNTLWVQSHLGVVSGSTAQPHIYLNDLRALPVPVPPIDEQRKIVEAVVKALERVTTLYEVSNHAGKNLAELDRSILSKAFRGALVPQDPSDEPAAALLARLRSSAVAPDSTTSHPPQKNTPPKKPRGRPRSV